MYLLICQQQHHPVLLISFMSSRHTFQQPELKQFLVALVILVVLDVHVILVVLVILVAFAILVVLCVILVLVAAVCIKLKMCSTEIKKHWNSRVIFVWPHSVSWHSRKLCHRYTFPTAM